MKVCIEPGCPALTSKTRCAKHDRDHDRARGTSTQRGYGVRHQAERIRWKPLIETGYVKCWRCQQPIDADGSWDLGHNDHDRSKYRGPEHAACNRATSGRTNISPGA